MYRTATRHARVISLSGSRFRKAVLGQVERETYVVNAFVDIVNRISFVMRLSDLQKILESWPPGRGFDTPSKPGTAAVEMHNEGY